MDRQQQEVPPAMPDPSSPNHVAGQVPGVHRWSVGAMTVTAIADGYGMLPSATVPDLSADDAAALARAAFIRPGDLQCIVNTFAVQTPSRLIMVDTGFGAGGAGHSGRIWANLQAAGIDPAAVDILVMTHGHPDHTSGMLKADGSAAFPNAEMMIHAREVAYWGDEATASRAVDEQKPWFELFRRSVAAYRSRTTPFDRDGQEIVPGVRVRELFGHTPGHSGLHLADGNDELLIWTDIVHFPHLQFARPELGVGFDVDPAQTAQTRRATLDMAAADRVAVAGMHLVFPGFGHVAHAGQGGYAFTPARWRQDLQDGPDGLPQ